MDANRRITVFNREAQHITGISAGTILQESIDHLPRLMTEMLDETLTLGTRQNDRETRLQRDDDMEIPLSIGSSVFRGHTGEIVGALLVFNDLTRLKKLEMQVRRTDRLASLGTLSAGMAHEIKNPLVTIKTFTELLPERYEDTNFRDTFSELVGHEVQRIDSIVNQLLRFARPAKPVLQPAAVHPVLEQSMRLIDQQLKKKDIRLVKRLQAASDETRLDTPQFEQALVNFLLNAIDATPEGGSLTLITKTVSATNIPNRWQSAETTQYIRISIADTGQGIPPENLSRIFDPFFTTKDHGTGMGLAVAHGIIEEHNGVVEVESTVGEGAVFHILLPLLPVEKEATA